MNLRHRWTDENGFRWYLFDGYDYPFISNTTILDCVVHPKLKQWFKNNSKAKIERVSKETADAGSDFHAILENHYKKQAQTIPFQYEFLYKAYCAWEQPRRIEPIVIEAYLHHPEYGYAGTCDMICKHNDKIEIWDFKTGRVATKHGWQLAGYKLAYEVVNACKVEGMRIVQTQLSTNTITDFEYKHLDFCKAAFLHAYQTWKALNFNLLTKPIIDPDGNQWIWPERFLKTDCFEAEIRRIA